MEYGVDEASKPKNTICVLQYGVSLAIESLLPGYGSPVGAGNYHDMCAADAARVCVQ